MIRIFTFIDRRVGKGMLQSLGGPIQTVSGDWDCFDKEQNEALNKENR